MVYTPNAHVARMPAVSLDRRIAANYGVFVHYVPGLTVNRAGLVVDLAGAADFDVEGFVADLVEFGVQYVRFTAWHKAMVPLYPSEVMRRWRGAHAVFSRDIIRELIDALRPHEIELQLYTHPRDGHDFSPEDQEKTGWGRGAAPGQPDPLASEYDFDRWNDFVAEAYVELLERYGSAVTAVYLDEGSERGDSEWVVDFGRLRSLFDRHAPRAVIVQNYYGNLYEADVADHEYGRWGEFESPDGTTWPSYAGKSVSAVVGSTWWASTIDPAFRVGYHVHDLVRYLVLQISACRVGGGLAFAAGPYAGGGWEHEVRDTLSAVGRFVDEHRRAVIEVTPSRHWPTPDGATVASVGWGVAVDGPRSTYLHFFTTPPSGTAALPPPSSGARPVAATHVASGRSLEVAVAPDGSVQIRGLDIDEGAVDTIVEVVFSADE